VDQCEVVAGQDITRRVLGPECLAAGRSKGHRGASI
jgi:hypothetical protein